MSAEAADVDLEELLEAVGEDTELTPEEKETSIWFGKTDDTARVFTAEAGLTRRFLAHPAAEIDTLHAVDEDGVRENITPEAHTGERIVGAVVAIPVGALQVKSTPRESTQHAKIVSERVLPGVGGEGGA